MQRLEVSGAVRPLYGSLGVKGLNGTWRRQGYNMHACVRLCPPVSFKEVLLELGINMIPLDVNTRFKFYA